MRLKPVIKWLIQIIVKGLGGGAGFVSAALIVTYHQAIFNSYEKIILCGIYGGFMYLYIAFFISTLLKRPVEPDLNTIWALYGVAAYVGAGTLCLVIFTGRDDKGAEMGFISGIIAFGNAVLLLADVIMMQIL